MRSQPPVVHSDPAILAGTPVFVGIREGYLENQDEVRQLSPTGLDVSTSEVRAKIVRASFVVCTPLQAAVWLTEWLR